MVDLVDVELGVGCDVDIEEEDGLSVVMFSSCAGVVVFDIILLSLS